MKNDRSFRPDKIVSYFRLEWLPLLLVTVSGLIYNVGLLASPWFEGRLAQCLADILGGNETAAKMAVLVLAYILVTLTVQAALNSDPEIDGILVQLPLPESIDENTIIEAISPEKDVDGFHPVNVGRLAAGRPVLLPCTPAGIMEMFRAYDISLDGKVCVMVGRSNIVGKPMGLMMLRANGTVIYAHSRTPGLADFTRQADILVVAAGHRGLISGDMIKPGAAVVDVAMNRDPETGKFTGDVVFSEAERVASYITPVPGGVGPMTRAMLMKNILTAAKLHILRQQQQALF